MDFFQVLFFKVVTVFQGSVIGCSIVFIDFEVGFLDLNYSIF